jgi:aspartyl-tRNA(Asn)/glutamyl-tRNA(Gln) amidotransferase subunit C
MSKFTSEDIKKLASLSRLKLSPAEIKQYQTELSNIVEYVERLQSVDLSGLEPTSQVSGRVNVMRDDEIVDYGTTTDELLKNAPQVQDRQFKVKRMIG